MKVHIDSDEEEYTNENGSVGFQFADVGKGNRKVHRLSPYDQKNRHRSVYYGLNLQGICRNQSCKVFERYVWVQKGFGFFRIAEEIDNAKCPICNQQLPSETVKSLGYTKAKVRVEGKRKGDVKRFEWQDKQEQGQLVKFEGYDSKNNVEWIFLNLQVKQL